MMTKDEALKMAIDLLESMKTGAETFQQSSIHIVCAACEEALAIDKESLLVRQEREQFTFDAQFDSGVLAND
jgi:uncharacterized protein YacL (UPF0231 family)